MSCALVIPSIPDLSSFVPALSLPLPVIDLSLGIPCCNIISFHLDIHEVNALIAKIMTAAAMVAAPLLTAIAGVVATIQRALAKLQLLLTFNCPLN